MSVCFTETAMIKIVFEGPPPHLNCLWIFVVHFVSVTIFTLPFCLVWWFLFHQCLHFCPILLELMLYWMFSFFVLSLSLSLSLRICVFVFTRVSQSNNQCRVLHNLFIFCIFYSFFLLPAVISFAIACPLSLYSAHYGGLNNAAPVKVSPRFYWLFRSILLIVFMRLHVVCSRSTSSFPSTLGSFAPCNLL